MESNGTLTPTSCAGRLGSMNPVVLLLQVVSVPAEVEEDGQMKIVVAFFESAGSLGRREDARLGAYDMPSVPDIGELVVIDNTQYTVESRVWRPGKAFTQVTVVVRKTA